MINKVILVGNLGRDPEVRSTAGGTAVANFSLATTRKWTKDGQRQEQTEWHNIVCFGRQAEVAGQYLNKGKQIYVEGRLQTNSWDDKNTGEKKYRTEIICDNFQMLGSRGGGDYRGGDGGGYSAPSGSAGPSGSSGPARGPEPEDDDIPF